MKYREIENDYIKTLVKILGNFDSPEDHFIIRIILTLIININKILN